MNPLTKVTRIYRAVLYGLAVGIPALMAGYTAIESAPPRQLIFVLAVVSALGGGTALSNLEKG